MLLIAMILGCSIGFAFGLSGFEQDGDVDHDPQFSQWVVRIVFVVLIFGIALYGGLFQGDDPNGKIDQTLAAIFGYGFGVFLHHEFNETDFHIGFIDRRLDRFDQAFKDTISSSAIDQATICLAAYFYRPFLADIEIASALKNQWRFRHWNSLDIQILIARHSAEIKTPNRLLKQLGLKQSKKLKAIFIALLQVGADEFVLTTALSQRLRMVATGAGLDEIVFDKILKKYPLGEKPRARQRQSYQGENRYQYSNHHGYRRYETAKPYQDEKGEKLAQLGLTADATLQDLKKAFRKLAVQYHPDRNMNKDPSTQKRASEKMKDINLAYDWLQANW